MIEVVTLSERGVNPFNPIFSRPSKNNRFLIISSEIYLRRAFPLSVVNLLLLVGAIWGRLNNTKLIWIMIPFCLIYIFVRVKILPTKIIFIPKEFSTRIAPIGIILEHMSHNAALLSFLILGASGAAGEIISLMAILMIIGLIFIILPFINLIAYFINIEELRGKN